MRKRQDIIDSKDNIIKLYAENNKNSKEIGVIYNCTHSVISTYLKKWGVKMRSAKEFNRKYTLDESYFEVIDTQEKAYFLGFMYADGTVGNLKAMIGLEENDSYILNRLKGFINYEVPLYFVDYSTKRPNWKNQYRLVIHSKKVCEDLAKLGCFPRKTYILEFPNENQVPKEFLNHFIRGYFDGDGCVYTRKWREPNRSCIIFTSSMTFCKGLKEFIEGNLDIDRCVLSERPNNIGELRIYGINKIMRFIKYMYNDSTISLDRKRENCTKLLLILEGIKK